MMNDAVTAGEELPRAAAHAPSGSHGSLRLWWHDLAAAARGLYSSPRYSLPALLSIALGIGAGTAVFAVFSALVLRPLPFANESELVRIGTAREGGGGTAEFVAAPFVQDFRVLADVFAELAGYRQLAGRMDTPGGAHEFSLTVTAPNFFDLLAVQPAQGRAYSSRGPAPDGAGVVVLRHAFWLEAFGGAPVVGQTVRLNDEPKLVVGILPDDQAIPHWADAWVIDELVARGPRFMPNGQHAVGRLLPGVSLEQAQQRLDALAAGAQHRDHTGALIGGQLTSLRDSLIGARGSSLALLLGAIFAFLLLACSNVAALLGTRAAVRRRELALRAALGAPRSALLRHSAFEAALLVLMGGALGLGLALPCLEVASHDYAELLGNAPPRLDPRVLAGFTGLLALTTLAGSLAPALQVRRVRPMDALRGRGRGSQSLRARRLREVLLAVQVAATLALLVNAGLLLRSLQELLAVDPGFQPDTGVVALMVVPTVRRGPDEASWQRQLDDSRRQARLLHERLQELPGAKGSCLATELPFDRMTEVLRLEGATTPAEPPSIVQRHNWGPGCFAALGIRLLAGREFTEQDGPGSTSAIAIINRSLARQLLHTEDAVGQRVRMAAPPGHTGPLAPWLEVVGVVDDVMESDLTQPAAPAVYFPFLDNPLRQGNYTSFAFSVVVRPIGAAEPYLTALPRFLREVLPNAAIYGVELTRGRLEASLGERRALERVLAAFGVSALVLAAIGLLAVTGYAVAERSAELGIRRALGASRRDILGLVLRETGAVLALGVAAGLVLCWLGRGMLRSFLFQVGAADPLTYASVCAGIFAVGLLAAAGPALAASRISPTRALAGR